MVGSFPAPRIEAFRSLSRDPVPVPVLVVEPLGLRPESVERDHVFEDADGFWLPTAMMPGQGHSICCGRISMCARDGASSIPILSGRRRARDRQRVRVRC